MLNAGKLIEGGIPMLLIIKAWLFMQSSRKNVIKLNKKLSK
jgi:hypothetical protein